jgi:hypothetical protein
MSVDRSATRFSRNSLELKIIQSYVLVLREPKNVDGDRMVTLERHGAYEVRLAECPAHLDSMLFWIELFDHNTKLTLDSYGGHDLEAVTFVAEIFISEARLLHNR